MLNYHNIQLKTFVHLIMAILVNPHNEREEKALLALLDSMNYDYKPGVDAGDPDVSDAFLYEYNKDIDDAEAEIETGNYLNHDEVEKIFAERRKKLNGN